MQNLRRAPSELRQEDAGRLLDDHKAYIRQGFLILRGQIFKRTTSEALPRADLAHVIGLPIERSVDEDDVQLLIALYCIG